MERLDRVAAEGWRDLLLRALAVHGNSNYFDNVPLMVKLEGQPEWERKRKGPKPFRFETL